MATSTRSSNKGQLSEEKTVAGSYYISRKEEGKFRKKFEDSLNLGQSKTLSEKPFLFLISGIGGIGKHTLLKKFEEWICLKLKEQSQPDPIIKFIDFQKIDVPRNPIDLMKYIDNEIESKLLEIEGHSFHLNSHLTDRSNYKFSQELKRYQKALKELCLNPIEGKDSVDQEQINQVRQLSELSGRVIGSALSAGNPTFIPIASAVGSEVGRLIPLLSENALLLKDNILNRHKATRSNEDLQNLILAPLNFLTPLFIEALIRRSQRRIIVLVFENHDKVKYLDEKPELDDWFAKVFLSPNSKLIENDNSYQVKFIISTRKKLSSREDWSQLKNCDTHRFYEFNLPHFTNEEVDQFIEQRLGETYKDLSPGELERFVKVAHGHPKYLEMICERRLKKELFDDSEINREIAEDFLMYLTNDQRKVIQRVSCCQWLDRKLTEYTTGSLKGIFCAKDFKWFEWLIQRHFVNLNNDKYHFNDLARQVFRRSFFQEDRDNFYNIHRELAKYFRDKANKVLTGKPDFLKYDDDEWCEYMGEFLYHSCFAQEEDFDAQFIYHLFAASYLRQVKIIENSYRKIVNEFELDYNPLIHSSTKTLLHTLDFIATYTWVSFELDYETGQGKYKYEIESTVLLCQSQLNNLANGIGKVAVLEYILKNLPISATKAEKDHCETQLRQEINGTANPIDPEFSSKLFMNSVCWQMNGRDQLSLEWCDEAIKYKSDNPSAHYRKGQLLENQAEQMYTLDKSHPEYFENLEKALDCYETALQMQPYDHRFWQARGNILIKLGENFKCMIHQALNKEEFLASELTSETITSSILQKIAYYQRAIESYHQLRQFRPNDDGVNNAITNATRLLNEERTRSIRLEVNIKEDDKSCKTNDDGQPNYSDLIQEGDRIRLQDIKNESDEDAKKRYEQALDKYSQAIHLNPSYPLGWYSRGLAYAELGKRNSSQEDLLKAIQDYNKSLELKSDLDWAFYDRGIAYHEIARIQGGYGDFGEAEMEYKQALHDFDNALRINPEYADAWHQRGILLKNIPSKNPSGKHQEAIASYDKAIQIYQLGKHPRHEAFAWYDRGRSYADLGLHEEAVASYKRSQKIMRQNYPNEEVDPETCRYLSLSLYRTGKHQEAMDLLENIINSPTTVKSQKVYALHDRGWLYSQPDFLFYSQDQAIKSYQEAIDHEFNHFESHKAIVRITLDKARKIAKEGHLTEAFHQFENLLNRINKIKEVDNKILYEKLREDKYIVLLELLRLFYQDASILHKFHALAKPIFNEIDQDPEYNVKLKAESDGFTLIGLFRK
jgi:tetratricopeptide (TPR) repeat protein